MKKLYSAGVVVYKKQHGENIYLLLQYAAGHWDFAKGKLEPGETDKEAALRELYEETGLTADVHDGFKEKYSYVFMDDNDQKIEKEVTFFVGLADNNPVILSREHINYQWAGYNHAVKMITYLNAKCILQQADIFLSRRERG